MTAQAWTGERPRRSFDRLRLEPLLRVTLFLGSRAIGAELQDLSEGGCSIVIDKTRLSAADHPLRGEIELFLVESSRAWRPPFEEVRRLSLPTRELVGVRFVEARAGSLEAFRTAIRKFSFALQRKESASRKRQGKPPHRPS